MPKSPVLLARRVACSARRDDCAVGPFIRSSVLLLRPCFERGSSLEDLLLVVVDDAGREAWSGRGMVAVLYGL